MSEKKEQQDISAGAEKVEKIEKTAMRKSSGNGAGTRKRAVKKTVRTESKEAPVSRREQHLAAKAKREELRAKKRIEIAKMKEQRKAQKLALKEERKKERFAKKEERIARKEMLKNESLTQRMKRIERERKEKLAARAAKRAHRREERLQKRENRLAVRKQRAAERQAKRTHKERRHRDHSRVPGFGGWLAAVIALGVVALAMTTLVTVGSINMAALSDEITAGYTGGLYEMVSLTQDMDNQLSKVRVANSAKRQQQLLTDILVDSELMEASLDHLPFNGSETVNVTTFINRINSYARELLAKIANGEPLTDEEKDVLSSMYKANAQIKAGLNEALLQSSCKDMVCLRKGKENIVGKGLEKLEENTMVTPQQTATTQKKTYPVGIDSDEMFSIQEAEARCKQYFRGYDIQTIDYKGETLARQIPCFNFAMQDGMGRTYFVQISKQGGKLVLFDSYESCSAHNFSVKKCEDIAEDFLEDVMGLDDMEETWVSENGSCANFVFAYEDDDVIMYPDRISVKVCETKGRVVGIDASAYWTNHMRRKVPAPKLTREEAKQAISRNVAVRTCRLCVIQDSGKDTLCYEVTGTFENASYYIYVDAQTGDEVSIYEVVGTKQGRILL